MPHVWHGVEPLATIRRGRLDCRCRFVYFALQSEVPMHDLDKALADITEIRSQLARGIEFRGYGPLTVAATGVLALAAAALQAGWLPRPAADGLGSPLLVGAGAARSGVC